MLGISVYPYKEDIEETLKYNLVQIDRKEKNNWVSLVFEYMKN